VIGFCNNLGINYKNYIVRRIVPTLSASDFIKQYDIEGVEYLKIDTEGHDCVILNAWLDACATNNNLYPKRIFYESKDLTDINDIMNMRNRLTSLNYKLNILGDDTEAILNT